MLWLRRWEYGTEETSLPPPSSSLQSQEPFTTKNISLFKRRYQRTGKTDVVLLIQIHLQFSLRWKLFKWIFSIWVSSVQFIFLSMLWECLSSSIIWLERLFNVIPCIHSLHEKYTSKVDRDLLEENNKAKGRKRSSKTKDGSMTSNCTNETEQKTLQFFAVLFNFRCSGNW